MYPSLTLVIVKIIPKLHGDFDDIYIFFPLSFFSLSSHIHDSSFLFFFSSPPLHSLTTYLYYFKQWLTLVLFELNDLPHCANYVTK